METVKFSEEQLWEIANRESETAQVIDESTYKEDWWMYHELTFALNGVHYSFVYREHVSPNVTHKEIIKDAEPIATQPISIDSEEEARFIWRELMKMGKHHMSVEDIQDVTDLQYQYLVKIGVAE